VPDPATDKNWKLKLRFGLLRTPYKHFTVVAEGVAGHLVDGYSCPPASACLAMKT